MKRLKKPLSVILATVLILSCFSVGFTAIAASPSELAELAEAIKAHPDVSNLSKYSVSNNSVTVSSDTSGAIWNAAEKFYAAALSTAVLNTPGDRNDSVDNNVGPEVIATLRNQLNDEAYFTAEEYASYNVNTLIQYFAGNPYNIRETGSTSSLSAQNCTFTVNVHLRLHFCPTHRLTMFPHP